MAKQTGIIYRKRCLVNGKGYTGRTAQSIKERDSVRFSQENDSVALKRAIAKYGSENFVTEIIESNIPVEMLSAREIFWIATFGDFGNGYNLTEGGEGFSCGKNNPMCRNKSMRLGKNNPMYGKKRPDFSGEKHPNSRPEYIQVKWEFIFTLPCVNNIKELRKHLFEKFSQIPKWTIYDWVRKWQLELE